MPGAWIAYQTLCPWTIVITVDMRGSALQGEYLLARPISTANTTLVSRNADMQEPRCDDTGPGGAGRTGRGQDDERGDRRYN
jgi:hypothetical protein